MDEAKRQRWNTSPSVQDLVSLAVFISRYRFIFGAACLLVFAGTAYYYHTHSYYTSRISFLVNSSNVAEVLWDRSTDTPLDAYQDDRGFNRVNQIIYSTQMIDYLVNQFDLYTHYQIDKKGANSYLAVTTKLKKHIGVSISKTRIITIQISDRLDYNVAANLANAIGKKINEFNRKITIDNLARKTEMLESLAKDLRSNSSNEIAQMDSLIKRMQRYISNNVRDEGFRQLLISKMDNLHALGKDYFKDLFESYKYRLYSMYSLQEKNLPSISILEKALPDKSSKHNADLTMYPLLLFFSLIIPLFIAYLLMKAIPLIQYIDSEMDTRKGG